MSDREGGEDDVGLPKATVYKLIAEKLKDEFGCSKEAKEVIVEACVEWVKLLSTEANEACDNSAKKTISPEHVTAALQASHKLSYERFIPQVEESNKDFKQSQKERARAVPDTKGMTQEQLLELQERLFSDSRNRLGDGPAE